MRARSAVGGVAVAVFLAACGGGSESSTVAGVQGFNGCQAGAGSVMTFLQRTLDAIDATEPDRAADLAPDFDEGVDALLLRAQEVHCTEVGFNDAIIARVRDLESRGTRGELLVDIVRERGLGSLDESRGGPIGLPTG